ncbi:hypothetical protein [Pseudoalteromonas aurantia]|uniref:Flagellar assembly protein FliH/Type III secretion system HrpE domain-containing protein n=1 Tax=Pseudoalteromonas aurantia TaxID=43654 RepID=A0A5S3V5T7_9GAMM|nr:hypothetical protein [Pseudoalteromonas aurantia]TMO66630.1 hypothetical protein CWC19_15815 [Pseudoalteromonas aurantia]
MTTVKTYNVPNSQLMSEQVLEPHTDIDVPKERPELDIKSQLLEMSARERESLIAEIFADDLANIVDKESQKGFKEGFAAGQEKSLETLEAEVKEQQSNFTDMTNKFTTLFDGLSKSDFTIVLESEAEIHEMLTTAIFKLLAERLQCAKYLEQAVEYAKRELIQDSVVALHLSPQDYKLLELSSNVNQLDDFVLKQDNSLSIGNYRFELAKGRVESNFSEKLALWTKQLTDLHREG